MLNIASVNVNIRHSNELPSYTVMENLEVVFSPRDRTAHQLRD